MRFLTILVATVLLAACASPRPAAERNYVLNAERPAQRVKTLADIVVYVAPLAADEPYDQRGFVYREAAQRFAVDPYRGYLSPPTRQAETRLVEWLVAAGATMTPDRNAARYLIDTRISALYVDLRPEASREAVVTLRIALRNGDAPAHSFTIDGRAPVKPVDGDGIAAATNTALADALSQLEATLVSESRATLR